MYTFKIENNKILATITECVYQNNDLSNMHFLIPKDYDGINVAHTNIILEYVLPISKEKHSIVLELKNSDYKNRLEYIIPNKENITSQPGELLFRIWINDKKIEYGKFFITPGLIAEATDVGVDTAKPPLINPVSTQTFKARTAVQSDSMPYSGYDPDVLLNDGRYPVQLEYTDFDYAVVDDTRSITIPKSQINITQESNSQYIPFRMNRTWDGVDLLDKKVEIFYNCPDGKSDSATPINFRYNSTYITFGWLISENVTRVPGNILFEIQVYGKNASNQDYLLKTNQNKDLTVLQSLVRGEIIQPEDPDWLANIVRTMNEKIAEVNDGIDITNNMIINIGEIKEEAIQATNRAINAASSLQVAVDAAASAKAAKNAAEDAKNRAELIEQRIDAYGRLETDRKYANAITGSVSGLSSVSFSDAWNAPINNLTIYGKSTQESDSPPTPDNPLPIFNVTSPVIVSRSTQMINWHELSKNMTVTRGTVAITQNMITITATEDDCHTNEYNNTYPSIYKIPVKPNTTYTFSWKFSGAIGTCSVFRNGVSDPGEYVSVSNTSQKLTITTTNDSLFLTLRLGVQNAGETCQYYDLMLNEGDIPLPWEEYQESIVDLNDIVLRGVGNVRDKLKYNDGIWGIQRWCWYGIFDGSDDETWKVYITDSSYAGFSAKNVLPTTMYRNAGICSQLRVVTGTTTAPNSLRLGARAGNAGGTNIYALYHSFFDDTADDKGVSVWTAHLSKNPMEIVATLTEPIWEPLSDNHQNQLNNLCTFMGIHSSVYMKSDVESDIELEYMIDINNLVKQFLTELEALRNQIGN